MCGIFGVLAGAGTALASAQARLLAETLLRYSQQRGRDASGIAALTGGQALSLVKQPTSPDRLLRAPAYAKLINDATAQLPICLIGHARMATTGSWQDDRNNQPLQRDGIALIHNGVLANPEELWARHPDPASRKAEVDTEALLALLADGRHGTGGLSAATRRVFGQLEGSASVAAICADDRKLLLASNTGSLFVSRGPQCLVFASEKHFLDTVRRDPRFSGIGLGVPQQVKPYSGLLVDIDTLQETALDLPYGLEPFPIRRFAFDAGRAAAAIRDWGFVQYDEAGLRKLRRCTRCILPATYPHIAFDADGVCNYCRHMKPTVVKGQNRQSLQALIDGYARTARDKNGPGGRDTYCILPLSGGRDSCYGTHMLVKEFGLKPLTYTYDWGMVTDLARRNIARVCGRLGLENILVSADITRKLDYIRSNVSAWLRQPDLGLIPLFMAGDKHFFSWVNKIKAQNGIDLNIWMMSPLENADFKEGFAGVAPHWERERTDYLSPLAKLRLLAYYGFAFLRNPGYINRSIPDTATGFLSFYVEPRSDYYNLFDFVAWNEAEVNDTIFNAFGWENAADSPNTWRIGDGTAPFYNYIYCTVAGFTENDTFRSNQIRNGDLSRDEALEKVMRENIPRIDGLEWYFQRIGLDMPTAMRTINAIPKRYAA